MLENIDKEEERVVNKHKYKEYYNILELHPKATEEEIRVNYRKLAKKWHPNKNKDSNEAEKIFHKISEAYLILSDPRKREIYDLGGNTNFTEYTDHSNNEYNDIYKSDENLCMNLTKIKTVIKKRKRIKNVIENNLLIKLLLISL